MMYFLRRILFMLMMQLSKTKAGGMILNIIIALIMLGVLYFFAGAGR